MPNVHTSDPFVYSTAICVKLRAITGSPGPGYRKLITMAADGTISPPMEKQGRWWGCYSSRLPELAAALGLTKAPPTPRAVPSRRSAKPDTSQ